MPFHFEMEEGFLNKNDFKEAERVEK